MCDNGHHIIYWTATTLDSGPPAGSTCACGEFSMPGLTGERLDDPTITELEHMWNLPAKGSR